MRELLLKYLSSRQIGMIYRLKKSLFLIVSISLAKVIKFLFNYRIVIYLQNNLQVIKKLKYKKKDIYINLNSEYEYGMRLHSDSREPDTVKWIEENIKNDDILYDIGANVGTYSLIAALSNDKNIKVYSFEPSFTNFYQLVRNVSVNNCEECMFPFNIAISDCSTVDYFNYSSLETGTAVHAFGEPLDPSGKKFTPVMRQLLLSFSLDELVYKYNLPAPNHLKIDVDGIEEKILLGASRVLSSEHLKTLLVEINEVDNEELIKDIVESKGLKFVSRQSVNGSHAGNYIFTRN